MIAFALPWAALLLPLPLLVYRLLPPAPAPGAPLYFPPLAALASVSAGHGGSAASRGQRVLLAAIWCALVLAACGPRWVGEAEALPASGRDLMLAVDISESMLTADMTLGGEAVDRLTLVKAVAGEFLRRRPGDRIGLILFGTNAYLHAPLTFDHATVDRLLQEAQIGFAGKSTAIGDALAIAVKRLRDRPARSRVLILLTDGANTAGEVTPAQAAELAAAAGLRVHTVGIGAEEMTLPGLFGSRLGARRVNPSADLDEGALRNIATLTRGRYFRARDQAELEEIYRELDRLEPVQQDATWFRPFVSLHQWPLGFALCATLALAARRLGLRRARAAADVGETR